MDVRNLSTLKADALLSQHNVARLDMLRLQSGVVYHADATAAITTPDATTAPTSLALAIALRSIYVAHCASECSATTGIGCHIAADATNTLVVAVPTDEASSILTANELKAKFNLHRVSLSFHASADSASAVATADATDEASLWVLLNALKVKFNLHFAGALSGAALVVVNP